MGTWLFRASGPLLILTLVLAVEALGWQTRRHPNLDVLILAMVLYATFVGGAGAGIVGGAIGLGYYAYRTSTPGAAFHYAPENLEDLVTTSGVVVLAVICLGHLYGRERALRREVDAAHRRTIETLDSITDAFFSVDRGWRYTFVNRAAEQFVQRSREELLGKVLWDAFPQLVGSAWDREYHRAVEARVAVDFEAFYPPLDAWIETRAYPSPGGLAIYLTDITARKRAQSALAARLRQQAAVAAMGMRSLRDGDPQALMDEAVATVAATLDVEAVKVLELLPDGEALLLRAGVGWKEGFVGRTTVDAGRGSQAGYTLVSREPVIVEDVRGETRFHAPPLLEEHDMVSGISVAIGEIGHPYGVLGAHSTRPRRFTADDVNFLQAVANLIATTVDRAHAAAVLQERKARFRQLAENIRDVCWLADAEDQRILYVNPAYEEIWGRSRESLYARRGSWIEAVHPDDRGRMEALSRDESRFSSHEFRVVRPDGDVRWIEGRLFPVRDTQGAVFRIVGVARDVTAARQAEEAARRLEKEEASRAAAEAAVRARDEVLAVVSHDLRSPLQAIVLGAQILDGLSPEPRLEKQIRIIRRSAERMSCLIQDLLDIGRIEAGRMAVAVEPIDLDPLLKEGRDALEAQASERSIRIHVHTQGTPRAYVDRERLLQVLSNVVGNAIKFTPPGGQIVVHAQPSGPYVEVAVSDTGPGVPADQIPHLFDRFWQACRTDRRGAGLGLSIVKGIVEAHGGRVWAESEVGKGTTIRFTLRAVGAGDASVLAPARGAA